MPLPSCPRNLVAAAFCASAFAPLGCSSNNNGGSPPPVDAGPPPDVGSVVEPTKHPTIQVTMNAYTHGGSGANTSETYLNVTNVKAGKFGRLFGRTVDGDIYAQPLYVGGLTMPQDKKVHNVVFVASSHDTVYAFDADDATASKALWSKSLGTSTPEHSPYLSWQWANGSGNCPGGYSINEIGITATPVIDPDTNTMYVVALDVETSNKPGGTCWNGTSCTTVPCNAYTVTYRLHALDLLTGAEKFKGPVDVTGSVTGSGGGTSGGNVTFDTGVQLIRTALQLIDHDGQKTVYFAAASYVDTGPYHGWVFAYDAATLAQTGIFNDTPNGLQGGIWQSGRGPIADSAGNLYVVTGNGTFDVGTGGDDYGDSVIKFNADDARTLSKVGDYFTQFLSDYQKTNIPGSEDEDLGSSGATLIPNSTLMLVTGKLGNSYLLDTASLGHWSPTGDDVAQELRMTWRTNTPSPACQGGSPPSASWVYNTPIAWVGPDGTHVYVWSDQDYLREFLLDSNGKLKDSGKVCWCTSWIFQTGPSTDINVTVSDPNCATPHSQGTAAGTVPYSVGGALAVSSNGTEKGTGILWATYPVAPWGDAVHNTLPGLLAAYDATDVSEPIWVSTADSANTLGNWAKVTPPTVANGKVYVATFSSSAIGSATNQLVVYGLLPE
jgi:hypothetical protein